MIARARLRRGDGRARAPALLPAPRPHPGAPALPARTQGQAREAAPEPLLGDARVPGRARHAGGRPRRDDRGAAPRGCFAIWLCGEAVGADVSPVVYIILGPLLFLVQMVPFTLNGLGLREAFFVVFLGRFGVPEDVAFAAGFLFYAVSVATSHPGRGHPALAERPAGRPGAVTVSIVIVSFNARKHLERCLDAVAGGAHEVVVVDNASEDGSPALVRERFPAVRLVELPENVGFGRGEQRRDGGGRRGPLPPAQLGRLARRRTRSSGWRPSPRSGPAPASSARGCATRTARSSARCAAGRPRGGWRPSTSSSAGSARARSAFNAFYGAGFDHDVRCGHVEVLKGAVLLVRREAYATVGGLRPGLLHVRRGDGPLLPRGPGRLGGRLRPGRGVRARRRRLHGRAVGRAPRVRPDAARAAPRPPALRRQASGPAERRAGPAAPGRGVPPARGPLQRRGRKALRRGRRLARLGHRAELLAGRG